MKGERGKGKEGKRERGKEGKRDKGKKEKKEKRAITRILLLSNTRRKEKKGSIRLANHMCYVWHGYPGVRMCLMDS